MMDEEVLRRQNRLETKEQVKQYEVERRVGMQWYDFWQVVCWKAV